MYNGQEWLLPISEAYLSALMALACVIVVSVLLGVAEFRRVVRKNPQVTHLDIHRHLPYLPFLVLGLLVVLGFFLSPMHRGISWALAFRVALAWEHLAWGVFLSVLGFFFSLSILLFFRSGHRRRWILLTAGIALEAALLYAHWRIYMPIAPLLLPGVLKDGVVMQTHGASCVAACAANVARYYGNQKTEREMAELLGTTVMGTSPAQVLRGMQRIDISCQKVVVDDRDPLKLKLPALLLVDHPATGSESHAVVVLERKEGCCTVIDPLVGKVRISSQRLSSVWRGRAIECAGIDSESQ